MGFLEWRDTSIKIFLILLFASILIFAYSFIHNDSFTGKSLAECNNIHFGKTVYAGDYITEKDNFLKLPLLLNADYLIHQIYSMDLGGLLLSFSTGAVPIDYSDFSSGGIDRYGRASGFSGPGYVDLDGDNLIVKEPGNFLWGYSTPYKVLVKTSSGVDVVENGTVIDSIEESQIKNSNFGNDFYNITHIRNWYNSVGEGSKFTLERGITNISDNRSDLTPEEINTYFGSNISNYTNAYPNGSPVLLYMGNCSESYGEVFSTYLDSHPEYGNDLREYNAIQFVNAWNNTFVPPNSLANGRAYTSFGTASDPEAPGGGAAHGVCPPARVLRDAFLAEGLNMPIGVTMGENAVVFGFHPSEDIKVSNSFDEPIKIVMWYEGSGTGMVIHAQIVKYNPN